MVCDAGCRSLGLQDASAPSDSCSKVFAARYQHCQVLYRICSRARRTALGGSGLHCRARIARALKLTRRRNCRWKRKSSWSQQTFRQVRRPEAWFGAGCQGAWHGGGDTLTQAAMHATPAKQRCLLACLARVHDGSRACCETCWVTAQRHQLPSEPSLSALLTCVATARTCHAQGKAGAAFVLVHGAVVTH